MEEGTKWVDRQKERDRLMKERISVGKDRGKRIGKERGRD